MIIYVIITNKHKQTHLYIIRDKREYIGILIDPITDVQISGHKVKKYIFYALTLGTLFSL